MKEYYLKKAEENLPVIHRRRIEIQNEVKELYKGDSFVLDLGDHYVGYLSFTLGFTNRYPDAPTRLSVKFCERPYEIDADFSKYTVGLCASWLQEETVTVDYLGEYKMPRRYAARYVKVTVLAAPKRITLSNFVFEAVTSADESRLAKVTVDDPELRDIDRVAVNTLRNCMHRVFEDGPKRDRRLWTGDLRLEALANYCTFDNRETVKRSLYLLAAGETNELGFLPSYIYETPYYFSGRDHIADYAMLFVTAVCDYFNHTGDRETLDDLLQLCKEQMDAFYAILDENGIVTPQGGWFFFIDWCQGLNGLTALMGVYLYALERFSEMLKSIGNGDAWKYEKRLSDGRLAAKKHLFDVNRGIFRNELDGNQISVHSQVWMILGGVIGGDVGKNALLTALSDKSAKQPFTPYMRHYVIEAMMKLGLRDDAFAHIKEIWGGMIERGADTFFEAYVPDDPEFSPYGDRMINSLCHAWSCTPTYFIRKYLI